MKNFWSKWFISASSGLFGRLLFLIIILGGGIVGSAYLLPEESAITKTISSIMMFLAVTVTLQFFFNLNTFKAWAQERRQDEIRKLELKKEIIELEIQRDNQQSPSDQEE